MMAVTTSSAHRACRCRCGASYDVRAFDRLAVVSVLAEPDLASIVVQWPAGVVVDVRACAACGEGIARLARP